MLPEEGPQAKGRKLKGAIPFDEAMAAMYRGNPKMAAEVLDECIASGERKMLWLTFRHLVLASVPPPLLK